MGCGRPKWFFPTTFAFQSVVLSFSSGNAIVLAQYLFATAGRDYTDWQLKGVAIVGYTVAFGRKCYRHLQASVDASLQVDHTDTS